MMSIVESYGHDNMSDTEVCCPTERLLNPELLEFHLTAFLGFLFPLAAFFIFFLIGDTVTAMLEFDFCAERPTFPEVISHIDDGMRNVELSMAWVVLMFFGL